MSKTETEVRTIWTAAATAEEATKIEKNEHWLFETREEAEKAIACTPHAVARGCKPFSVVIAVRSDEVSDLETRATQLAADAVSKAMLETTEG